MTYKFFSTPNHLVKERKRILFTQDYEYKPIFRFDTKGEYITDDPKLIQKLKRHFKYEEVIKCKLCEFSTNNQGNYLNHMKLHKKNEEGGNVDE